MADGSAASVAAPAATPLMNPRRPTDRFLDFAMVRLYLIPP